MTVQPNRCCLQEQEKIHGEEQHRKRRLTHRSTDFIGTAPEEY